jgi:II/X family phage/plasmid replication protein
MSTELAIGVDTVEFTVPGINLHLPNTTTANLSNDDGELKNSYQNRVRFRGKYNVHKLSVRTEHMGSRLAVEGSLYGFGYGQNAFVPGDLQYACSKALRAVRKRTGLRPSESKQDWELEDINLERVDLVMNFRLDSQEEVMNVIRQLKRQFIEQEVHVHCYGGTVHWMPGEGREYSIRFYSKWLEMWKSKRQKDMPEFQRLLQACNGILRVELQLREEGLQNLNLEKASAWTDDSPETVFRKYMKRLPLLNVTFGPLTDEELKAIPAKLRHVLALHKAGYDLEKIFGIRTLQRYRKAFKELGIDLRCPNRAELTAVPLLEVLAPKRSVRHPPRWLKEAGLYRSAE